jgi:hypothetical protein
MKYRKDITDFLILRMGDTYKKQEFKIYEQDNVLYMADYEYGKNEISRYAYYSLLWNETQAEIRLEIEEKFKVKFASERSDIICKCGKSKSFSAFYEGYGISLRCNECQNEFSAYEG